MERLLKDVSAKTTCQWRVTPLLEETLMHEHISEHLVLDLELGERKIKEFQDITLLT